MRRHQISLLPPILNQITVNWVWKIEATKTGLFCGLLFAPISASIFKETIEITKK